MVIDITKYMGSSHTRDLHLLALEIANVHKTGHPIILDQKHEGWDIVETGIEQVVKQCADSLNIPYSKITFRSSDRLSKSSIFKHEFNNNKLFWKQFTPSYTEPLENNYVLLLGRATNERLYAFSVSSNSNSIRTCHLNAEYITEHTSDFTQFICEHNSKWQSIKTNLPYSDVGDYIKPPIIFGNSQDKIFWSGLYDRVSIEVVCETNTTSGTFFITEKTIRPISYGRLFLVIGSPNYERNLKELGFDTFDDILDKSYDTESSYIRVDKVFNSLKKFMQNPVDYSTITARLKNNQQRLIELANE